MNSTEGLTKDEVFDVLSSSRRRLILYHLHRRSGRGNLRTLARDTAIGEVGEPVDNEVVKRFYISLYQTHIPKLEETGLVVYDAEEKSVVLTDRVADIAEVLNEETTPDRPWATYYAVLALCGLLIGVGQLLWAVSVLSSLLYGGALLSLATVQYYETQLKPPEYTFFEQLVRE